MLIHDMVTGERLSPTLETGTIDLPLTLARELTGGTYLNIAGNGGFLASDSTPAIAVTTGGTRITWVATNVDAIAWQVIAPADFDETEDLVVHLIASMSATNDTPVIGVAFKEALLNQDEGGNTAAVSGTTPTAKTVTVAADSLVGGDQWNITLTPAAHGTDALRVDACWITYKRK